MIMIRISNIKIAAYKEQHKVLEQEICRLLHIKSLQNLQYHIVKKSVDARKKDSIQCIYTVDVSGLKDEAKIVAFASLTLLLSPMRTGARPALLGQKT